MGESVLVSGMRVRRDIADLVLEALDVARSRNLAGRDAHALILEVLMAERPDIPVGHAERLIERVRQRFFGGTAPGRQA